MKKMTSYLFSLKVDEPHARLKEVIRLLSPLHLFLFDEAIEEAETPDGEKIYLLTEQQTAFVIGIYRAYGDSLKSSVFSYFHDHDDVSKTVSSALLKVVQGAQDRPNGESPQQAH